MKTRLIVATSAFITAIGFTPNEQNILDLLKYAAQGTIFGCYHTITLGGQRIQGGRDPQIRLKHVSYDFTGKVVLDIGSNLGGMLFALADKIKYGVGIDYDVRTINLANRLRDHYKLANINFFVFNLEQEPVTLIRKFVPEEKIDICFMLAIAAWVKNWKEIATFAATIAPSLLFEAHGGENFQAEQIAHLRTIYKEVTLLSNVSDDDSTGWRARKLFICQN